MNATARYPHVKYRSESSGSVSGAGTLLLTETARPLRLVEALEDKTAAAATAITQQQLTAAQNQVGRPATLQHNNNNNGTHSGVA